MKVIQLRGVNAVGKTTIVREFINKNEMFVIEENINNNKVYITTNKDYSIIILGKYGEKWGGCDTFKDKVQVFETIIHIIKKYKSEYIIFEGLLYGKTFQFAYNLNNYLKKFNYTYLGITLNSNFEFVLNRLKERNNNSDINIEALYSTWKSVLTSHNKLIKANVNMKLIDITSIKYDDMYKILEKEV